MDEGQTYDKKSLLTFASDPTRWDWKKIAKHCVAFANANGGLLDFGLEDDQSEPPPEQRIHPALAEKLRKGIGHQCVNVAVRKSLCAPFVTRSANCVKTQSSDTTVSVASARVISLDIRMANNDLFIRQNAKSEGIFS